MKITLGLGSLVLLAAISVFIFPFQIKLFITESVIPRIYSFPLIKNELDLGRQVYMQQQRKHEGLVHYVIDNFTEYSIDFYDLPFPSYRWWRDKPSAYLEQTDNKIIIASGAGKFIYADKKDIENKSISFNNIDTNIKKIITDDLFYRIGATSIKDLKVINDFIYLSYTKKVSNSCYNISVLRSIIDFEMLEFEEVFSPNECVDHQFKKQNGGRIFPYKDGKILLSVGAMNNNKEAQKTDSVFGKIISFTPMSDEYEILSMGHRNPQGLYYDSYNDVIINSEHQALGGDEVNINIAPNSNAIKNYGWPISSYSSHYGRLEKEDEPLHKSHSDFGFIEPSIYFTPSLGVSQIIKAPVELSTENSNDYLLSSMGYGMSEGGDMSLHHLRFNSDFSNVVIFDIIPIGERIRDLEILNGSNEILLILESIPAFAILQQKNYLCDKNKSPCHYDKKFIRIDPSDYSKAIRKPYEDLLP